MNSLKTFATEAHPLHPSGIAALISCPLRMALMHMFDPEGEGGTAADTGSAMHKAAAAFHKGKEVAESIEVMGAHLHEYPKADLQDAASLFLSYSSDPRNRLPGFPLVEQKITFTIAPAPEDITQAPIAVEGQLDQVRDEGGRLKAWDIKTSKKDPTEVLAATTFQLAAYCIGASIHLGRRVEPGGIIMPRLYRKDVATSPVFRHFVWTFDDIEQILLPVRILVANIRAGRVWHLPNKDCIWCHMRTPDLCLPKLKSLELV